MSEFEDTEWSREEGVRDYLDHAEIYVQDRRMLLGVLRSFYRTFVSPGAARRVVDLGCGDGILGEALKSLDPSIPLTAVDGSEEMLTAARRRLGRWGDVEYVARTFQEILRDGLPIPPPGEVGLVASSFAIHHLAPPEKKPFFGRILEMLAPGGHLLNIDIVRPRSPRHEAWYDEMWREWIRRRQGELNVAEDFSHTPEDARKKPENRYETLADQLRWLEEAGFTEVECHYRRGLFGVYSGRKPQAGG